MTNFNPQFEKIGDILIHEGIIDQSQLSEALEDQKIKKDKIVHILLGKGYITENSLASAFSMQLGFKMISGEDLLNSDEDVVSLLSEDFSKENLVIAVKKTDTTVILAMEDPENLEVIDSVKKMTNLKPEIHVAGKSDIENALVHLYDRINKSGQIQDAISNISIVSGDEEDDLRPHRTARYRPGIETAAAVRHVGVPGPACLTPPILRFSAWHVPTGLIISRH